MNKSSKIVLSVVSGLMMFVFFSIVSAQNTIPNPLPYDNLIDLLKNVANFIRDIALMLAVPFIVWGGITILSSGGNPAQVEKGKMILLYTVIGLIVTLLADLGLDLINQLFQVNP
jgi:hypothetical protein